MNLPAILLRELRVLCRRRSTYGLRLALAAAAVLLWSLWSLGDASPTEVLSRTGLTVQLAFSLMAAAAAAGTINTERREGTLGLLLLTPLRPWEVLAGKLAVQLSQFLLCLCSILPILFLPLLAGEVDPAFVARQFGGILAACLLGTAIGLCASVACLQAGASLILAVFSLLLLHIVPYLGYVFLEDSGVFRSLRFYWIGPILLTLSETKPPLPASFGSWPLNMAIATGISLMLFALCNLLFLKLWRSEKRPQGARKLLSAGKADPLRRPSPFPEDPDSNPFLILDRRRHSKGRLPGHCWAVLLAGVTFYLILSSGELFVIMHAVLCLLLLGTYMKALLEASQPLYRARQSGMLELVATSPLGRSPLLEDLAGTTGNWNFRSLFFLHFLSICWIAKTEILLKPHPYDKLLDEFFFFLHLGLVFSLLLDLHLIKALGQWSGLRHRRPAYVSMIFLILLYLLPFLFLIPDIFSGDLLLRSIFICFAIRALLGLLLLLWCRMKAESLLGASHRFLFPEQATQRTCS